MDEARRKDLQARFGADPETWPPPFRAEAMGRNIVLLDALDLPLDEAALSQAVLTRLAQPARQNFRFGLPLAFATYAGLALAFGIIGYQGGDAFQVSQSDPILDLALGSVTAVLQ